MCGWAKWACWIVAGLGWVVAGADVLPPLDPLLSDAASRLALGAAVAASMLLMLVWVQRPAEDVWQAGREHGRREVLREMSGSKGRTVVSMLDRRRA